MAAHRFRPVTKACDSTASAGTGIGRGRHGPPGSARRRRSATTQGGGGTDDLYGGSGADTFLFDSLTAFSASVTVHDFSTGDADKLDLSHILTGFDPVTAAITDFVHVNASSGNAVVSVDADGAAGGAANFVQIATLTGGSALAGTEADLLANGHLLAYAA